jgi:very-short-patch-repair endonuclease
MTDAERKLWWRLREIQIKGTHFRRQATIGPYYADFACHERRVVIEVDGGGHAEKTRASADEVRTNFLISRGYRVLRFWNHVVLKDTDAVMEAVTEALQVPPTPYPSPPRARARGGKESTHSDRHAEN